jgi:putative two-component system response regulator
MKQTMVIHYQQKSRLVQFQRVINSLDINCLISSSLDELFHIAVYGKPALLLLEINHQNDANFKVIKLLKRSPMTWDVPIIAFSDSTELEFIDTLVIEGCSEILSLPSPDSLLRLRIETVMRKLKLEQTFEEEITAKTKEMQVIQSIMVESLAILAEYRDADTGEHIKRTQNYVKALALYVMRKGLFLDELNEYTIELIYQAIPLHDIGKVCIPDYVLLKPGKLTNEEFKVMKTHTTLGHEAILHTSSKMQDHEFLSYADDVAYTHQEKYDGTGYPRGLKGNEIPLIGRLMAIADVYDAMTSKRVYKDAMSHEQAFEIIKELRGSHFDPILVDCAVEIESTFENIAITYKDTSSDSSYPNHLVTWAKEGTLKSILLVDDSRIIRSILKNQLETIGFYVDEAEDGVEALKQLKVNQYDLILCDVEMPNMDGYTFSKTAVKQYGEDLLIIIMTASDYDATEKKLAYHGAKGLLLKPLDLKRLETKLMQIFSSSEGSQHDENV